MKKIQEAQIELAEAVSTLPESAREEFARLIRRDHIPDITRDSETGALLPKTYEELLRMAKGFAQSGLVPVGCADRQTGEINVHAVAIAIEAGISAKLSPIQSLQSVMVVNGRPSIWGDAPLGLVRASGLLTGFKEWIEGKGDDAVAICRAQRGDETIERRFSVADAKRAGLWGRNVWKSFESRMLQLRARAFAMRDGFSDVLLGLPIAEEVRDYQEFGEAPDGATKAERQDAEPPAGQSAAAALASRLGAVSTPEAPDAEKRAIENIEKKRRQRAAATAGGPHDGEETDPGPDAGPPAPGDGGPPVDEDPGDPAGTELFEDGRHAD